jgi:hypothetical protein
MAKDGKGCEDDNNSSYRHLTTASTILTIDSYLRWIPGVSRPRDPTFHLELTSAQQMNYNRHPEDMNDFVMPTFPPFPF